MLFHGKLHQLASYHTILYTGHQATPTCASSYIMRGPNLCDEMTTSLVTRPHKQFIRVTLAHFVTQSVIIPWPRIIFHWRKLSFSLHIRSAIIRIIIYFERIITDIIILWNEKKGMYYFLKINEIVAWCMEEKLNTCMWHVHLPSLNKSLHKITVKLIAFKPEP